MESMKKQKGHRSGRGRVGQPRKMKSGENNCFNERNLQTLAQHMFCDLQKVIAELTIVVRVRQRRLSRPVIQWLTEQAENFREAKELLEFIEIKNS